MANGEDHIRDLIRLMPAVRALKENLEESIHMERFASVGDSALRLYQGLYSTISGMTTDPYLSTLSIAPLDDATDEQKTLFVHMATGQLLAFLEGQVGVVNVGGARSVHLAPRVQFMGPVNDLGNQALRDILAKDESAPGEEGPEGA
ncbi:MAG TPA: hypothetical protein VGN26_14700 [Armatimonadota bacterium]|jgi:hypothetical protein